LRTDIDFHLWYICDDAQPHNWRSERRLAVVARWSAHDGSILVWKSRQMFLDLRSTGYWRPLRLEMPLMPRAASWLRFDLVTDGGPSSDPVCTGFLFCPRKPDGRLPEVLASKAFGVLGLSRLPNDGASRGVNGRYLDRIGQTCAKRPITLHASAAVADMVTLSTDQIPGLEALFFVGWDSLGRSLVGARVPTAALQPPQTVALPGLDWCSPGCRIYGYTAADGFIGLTTSQNGPIVRQ
jgi:hypothetical protein